MNVRLMSFTGGMVIPASSTTVDEETFNCRMCGEIFNKKDEKDGDSEICNLCGHEEEG